MTRNNLDGPMKAAVLEDIAKLVYRDHEMPVPGTDDVIVKVGYCGICGSDLPRILTTGTYSFPTIPGHEFMGTVVECGSDKYSGMINHRCAVIPLIPCRECEMCRAGLYFHCPDYDFLGSRSNGGFAQYVKVPAANIVLIEDGVSDDEASMMEPISVASHCVNRVGINPDDTVVVFGAGAIGIFIAQWAKIRGAGRVVIIDIRQDAIDIARQCGIETCMNAASEDILEQVLDLSGQAGVDVCIEAAGSVASTHNAIRLTKRTGRVGLVGRIDDEILIPEDVLTSILRKEITIFGIWGFRSSSLSQNDWEDAADMLSKNRLAIEPMITHTYPLSDINNAIEMMDLNNEYYCKVLVKP